MRAGWPRGLPEPSSEGFEAAAVRWLLDAGPGDLRGSDLRRYPVALAAHVRRLIGAELDATRASYARARTELGSVLPPDALSAVQQALEAEGARLLALCREAELVQEALDGRRT